MELAIEREPLPRRSPSENEDKKISEQLKIEQLRDFLIAKAISPDTPAEQKKFLDWQEIKDAEPERLRELQLLIQGVEPGKILKFPDKK